MLIDSMQNIIILFFIPLLIVGIGLSGFSLQSSHAQIEIGPSPKIGIIVDNIPPVPPDLLSPKDGSTITDSTPLFDWTDVSDPSVVSYKIEISTSKKFDELSILYRGSTSDSQLRKPSFDNGTYYWRVYAVDDVGNTSKPSDTFQFTIDVVVVSVNKMSLTLDPLSPQVKEDEPLVFSGTFEQTNDQRIEPLDNLPICIVDNNSKKIISFARTDDNGRYVTDPWLASYLQKSSFVFYAVSYDDCQFYDYSTEFQSPSNYEYFQESERQQVMFVFDSTLIFDQIPFTANVGDTIPLTGHITQNRFVGETVSIIVDDLKKFSYVLDDNGTFSDIWEILPEDIGPHKIYAECFCNGSDLISNSLEITVMQNNPLIVQIMPDKISGTADSTINFASKISGGKEPYQYVWSINGKEISDKTPAMTKTFSESGKYEIILTVTDALEEQNSDNASININEEIVYPIDLIKTSGDKLEGSEITFSVTDQYPVPIESYYWEFHDNTDSINSIASKTFDDNGQYEVRLTVVDQNNQKSSSSVTVDISNVEPEINNIKKSTYEIMQQETISLEANFIDPGTADTFDVKWFLNSNLLPMSENKDDPSSVRLSHTFTDPGNHEIKLIIVDDDEGQDTHVFFVIVKEEPFHWWILIAIAVSVVVIIAFVAKSVLKKPRLNISKPPSPSVDNYPNDDDKSKRLPSIDMDIEFRSGIEKK